MKFYDDLAPFYHLIYPDWENSINQQASILDSLIHEYFRNRIRSILDISCGIGTQCLGLAKLGYDITASDISKAEIERAKHEAELRELSIHFSISDMRETFKHHAKQFDLVISCDNSIPHLLTDEDIVSTFQQCYQCTTPGGGLIISVRDYEKENTKEQTHKLYGIREEQGVRYIIFQTWEFHNKIYDLNMYFIEDSGNDICKTRIFRSQYYAIGIPKLINFISQAGFENIQRLDNRFFQPVIIGKRKT